MSKTFSDSAYEKESGRQTKVEFWDSTLKDVQFGRGQASDAMLNLLERFTPKETKIVSSSNRDTGKMTIEGTRTITNWVTGRERKVKRQFVVNIAECYGLEGMAKFDAEMEKLVNDLLEQK